MPGITSADMHCVLKMYLMAHGKKDTEIHCTKTGVVVEVNAKEFKCEADEAFLNLRGGTEDQPGIAFMFCKDGCVTRCVQNIVNKEDCVCALRKLIPICPDSAETAQDNCFESRIQAIETELVKKQECFKRIDCRLQAVEASVKGKQECFKRMDCRLQAVESALEEIVKHLNGRARNR
jgi:hypothetical protein